MEKASPPTFWNGLPGPRGRPDPQNDRFPILKKLNEFIAAQSAATQENQTPAHAAQLVVRVHQTSRHFADIHKTCFCTLGQSARARVIELGMRRRHRGHTNNFSSQGLAAASRRPRVKSNRGRADDDMPCRSAHNVHTLWLRRSTGVGKSCKPKAGP